jgi:ferredoxin-NADP reductase
MGFLQDFTPVFRKSSLAFVESVPEAGNISSFLFRPDGPLSWKAGQHGIFFLPGKMEGGAWRGFSVASHPGEGVVRIATRITDTPSAFKRALTELKPGDSIAMRGPFGPFYLDGSRRPVVFVAGGVGITPYRSMILDAARDEGRAPAAVRLLYADDSARYAFQRELGEAAANHGFLAVDYLTGADLPAQISRCVRELGDQAVFYISGSVKMVKAIKQSLIQRGISKKNIRHEMFLGL